MPTREIWPEIEHYLSMGGSVMIPLLCVSVLLWFLLGLRLMLLRRGFRGSLAEAVDSAWASTTPDRGILGAAVADGVRVIRSFGSFGSGAADALDEVIIEQEQQVSRYRKIIGSLVAVAPLLGLLGTVSGMIETFSSLGDMALFAQSGGVAGGISEALVTTQVGLFIAVPGLLVERLLDRRASCMWNELRQLKRLLLMRAAQTGG